MVVFSSMNLYDSSLNSSQPTDAGQLSGIDSLKRFLKGCLLLDDNKWMLAVLDTGNTTDVINNQNIIIHDIGAIIDDFCQQSPAKRKGVFNTATTNSQSGECWFAVLIKLFAFARNNGSKYISSRIENLMKQMDEASNQTARIGFARMETNYNDENSDDENQWMERALKHAKVFKTETRSNEIELDAIFDAMNGVLHCYNLNTDISINLGTFEMLKNKVADIERTGDENCNLLIVNIDNMGMNLSQTLSIFD